jgi:integrase
MSEAIELDWRDLDLQGNRAIFWRTKTGKRRIVVLPPRAVADLATLPHREGSVFRWETTPSPKGAKPSRIHTYADRGREEGGHIKRAWQGAIRRARLDPELTPHDCRHTWASWHYALHKDLLRLKAEGGWSSVTLVERYAHLLPAGQEAAIRHFLGWHHGDTAAGASPARP